MSDAEFDTFLDEVFKRYAELSKDTTPWYVFHSSSTQDQFKKYIEKTGWQVRTQIIWNKPSATMGWSDYRMKHEPMFYCGKENTTFYGDRTGTSVWDFHKEMDDLIKWAKTIQKADQSGKTTIWTMKREPVGGYVHPTQKPVELIGYAIRNSSKNGDIVVDLFGGSGATMIACGKKGRRAFLMELDPRYIDVIVSRYCDYTGNYDIIKNGEPITWPKSEKNKTQKKITGEDF
jgi:DNA modification methylase